MMVRVYVLVLLFALANARVPRSDTGSSTPPNYKPNEFELEQNRAARYEFSSNVEDHINDLMQQRDEVRDGLNVKGSYSYSDGYYKRTVHYEADDKGYRVTGEEVVPLDGPKIDLTGTASVNNAAHGTRITYKVQSIPVPGPVGKIVD
ncbi:pro-resilin-like [Tenebrio molitor]|uniref:pro-resilin-like n=1 Tax=Tenebrio molitor TaxID=7067 RepID=UPI0036247740